MKLIKYISDMALNKVDTALNIVCIGHANPDGDAVGSILCANSVFNKLKYNSIALLPNKFPDFLMWLKDSEKIKIYTQNKEYISYINNADVILCFDFNSPSRVKDLENALRESKAKKILVDHHLNPDIDFFDLVYSKTDISSTSELWYELCKKNKIDHLIEKDEAEAIYTGIVTDTGSLSYSCYYKEIYLNLAELIAKGLDVKKCHPNIFSTNTKDKIQLMGYAFNKKIIFSHDNKVAYIALDKKELDEFNYKTGDTEGFVNQALSVKSVQVSALLSERNDHISISLRSIDGVAVNGFANEIYGGGGHVNAAGGSAYVSLDEAIEMFTKNVHKILV